MLAQAGILSGFLITSLILEEFDRSGRVDFPRFYLGRARRLLPALGLMLIVVGIVIDNKEKMLDNRRRLQDAYLRDLYGVLAFRRADEQIYNLDAIQTRLRRISDQIMGSGIIDTVVVKTTLDRRFSASDR